MAIHGECPGCGRRFQAPDNLAGRRVKCPNCSAVIEVASGDQQRTARSAPSAEQAAPTPTPAERPAIEQARWYVKTAEGEPLGPISKAQVDALVAEGRLDGFCQVRREDWRQWKWAEAVYPQFALAAQPETQQPDASPEAASQPATANAEPRLRACPDCGKMVSRRASRCPDCGCPLGTSDHRAAVAEPTGQQAQQAPPATTPSEPNGRGSQGRIVLFVVGGVSAVLLICIVVAAAVAWHWFGKARRTLSQYEDQLRSVTGELAAPNEPPERLGGQQAKGKATTPEQMRQWIEQQAAAMAKQVDEAYRRAHLAGSLLERTEKSADLLRSVIEDPLGSGAGEPTRAAEGEGEPSRSQYDALYKECLAYLRDNTSTDQPDRSRVQDLARDWAEAKRRSLEARLEEQLQRQLGL